MISSSASNRGKGRALIDDLSSSLKSKLAFYGFLIFSAFSSHASSDSIEVQVTTFNPARALEPKVPAYPESGLHAQREAWVYVYFVVDEEGSVGDINVLDSIGGSAFERSVRRALRQTNFQPATLDGEPIVATSHMKYKFELEGYQKAATGRFLSMQRRFQKRILDEDRNAADSDLEDLRGRAKSLYEFAWLGFAEFTYHRKWGTKEEQLRALEQAIAYEPKANYLPEEMFHAALASKVILEFQLKNYRPALSGYNTFMRLETGKEDFESTLQAYADRIIKLREDRSPFAKADEFDQFGRWSYGLLWNTFSLDLAEPPTSDLMLRCPRKSVTFEYKANLKYEVPDSVGNCTLFVEGSPNSAVTLYQL